MRLVTGLFSKRLLCTGAPVKPQICVVGAGPAGFYAAQHLVKHLPGAQVDIYERLPVPFGLVRFGVAPDHPEVKNVINTFTKTAENPGVRFLGNINVGKDITVKRLKEAYHAVLLTYGADENRKLGVPGENLSNIISAKSLVGWYNGVPWDKDLTVDLNGPSVAIFGQGNVAVDVARILLTPIDLLKTTDITQHALDQLAASKIKKVHLIGRRGPLQAAFTIKELREMLKLPNCAARWNGRDFEGVAEVVPSLARPKKRITELMLKSVSGTPEGSNDFNVIFFRSPSEFVGGEKVTAVRLGINKLEGSTDFLKQKAVATGETELLECQLGVTSIGYKSIQIDPDIPFDETNGVAVNTDFKISEGFYASGWLATGPTGVILTTMSNAFATADIMVKDFKKNLPKENRPGFVDIEGDLKLANVQVVEWKDWAKIDRFEQEEGAKVNKPREKIVDVGKMLEVAS